MLHRRLTLPLWLLASASSYAAHPLQTDDTGTQGTGHWQLELNSDRTRSHDRAAATTSVALDSNATLTRGCAPALDIYANLPWSRQNNDDGAGGRTRVSGRGDAALGFKWRALELNKLSFGLKTELTFPTGDDNRGLGVGRANLGLTGLANYELGDWTLLGNLTLKSNRARTLASDQRHLIGGISIAALYRFAEPWRALADIGTTQGATHSTAPSRYALIGLIFSPTETLDVDIGLRRNRQGNVRETKVGAGMTVRF